MSELLLELPLELLLLELVIVMVPLFNVAVINCITPDFEGLASWVPVRDSWEKPVLRTWKLSVARMPLPSALVASSRVHATLSMYPWLREVGDIEELQVNRVDPVFDRKDPSLTLVKFNTVGFQVKLRLQANKF